MTSTQKNNLQSEPPPNFDLLLRGGRVIDPANRLDTSMDVAISNGKIVAVSPDLDPKLASSVADVSGMYVTPGLVDIHTHSFRYFNSTVPDEYAIPNGVTTIVDAGGPGWKNFEEFKRLVVDKTETRLFALLNVAGPGMTKDAEQDITEMHAEPIAEMIDVNRDLIIGVKTAHYDGPGWESVDTAVAAGKLSDTFVMVDFHQHPNRSYKELLLKHMRPGDIHTHMYATSHLLNEDGQLQDYMIEARLRGILFDVGHGAGSFRFRFAKPSMDQGFGPDTLSTDAHKGSIFVKGATMPLVISKVINMGMSLYEAVDRSTRVPAHVIGRPELGTLTIGSEADVAVFDLEEGEFGFVDSELARMNGNRRLRCHMTLRAGRVMWDLNGLTLHDWDTPR